MLQNTNNAESIRLGLVSSISKKQKSELGQFMTPSNIAHFMASMFSTNNMEACCLLDAGAGVGALTCAFLDRWIAAGIDCRSIDVTAYEIDRILREHLERNLNSYNGIKTHILADDYIKHVTDKGLEKQYYTHVILNPPYKKINSKSLHREALRKVGIETVNLYSAFVALAVAQTVQGGQIVAIIPRSFCNGPYYRSFRNFILAHTSIRHIHLFKLRNKAFKDESVLQENVILHLECAQQQGMVTISTSTDDSFSDYNEHCHPFDQIVLPDDQEFFIHIPTTPRQVVCDLSPNIQYTLSDLGLNVSTGPVVDFRVKESLRSMPGPGTVPLLYPIHFASTGITWPIEGIKKSNAIERNADTEKWLYPSGFYCTVRRFSSKEEKRRIVAGVVDPSVFGNVSAIGFENHLNLFHENKRGLPEALAHGLALFLNSTAVDEKFRCFSGHTQVNATDLKILKYPSRKILMDLGEWAMKQVKLTQTMIDTKLGELIA